MNEENNNLNVGAAPASVPAQPTPTPAATQPEATPVAAPAQEVAPVQQPVAPTPAPVQPEAVTVAVPVQETLVQEVAAASPSPVEAAPAPAPVAQEVAPAPTPQVVVPAPVQEVPVQETALAAAPVQTETTSTPVAQETATPAQTDIAPQEALNPLANDPVAQAPVQATTPSNSGVIAPSVPLAGNGLDNVSQVGFVATGTQLKKKKNKFLILGIVLAVLVGLGLLGYFVVYPYIVKNYLSDPKNVYTATINAAFKELTTTVDDVVHTKAIYDIQGTLDTNIESLKSYSGYTYGINYGIDPKAETIQAGITLKDKTNVGHSYYTYLKDGKEYIRYSTYRDLIFAGEADMNEVSQLFVSFQDMLDSADKANNEDINYIINKVNELLVSSIDESKLSKEEASITINGENLKVTNNKYVISEETATNMILHIIEGIKNDSKSISILANMTEITEQELKDFLDEIIKETKEDDDECAEDDEDCVKKEEVTDEVTDLIVSIYTTGLKNDIVGYAFTTSDNKNSYHYFKKDNYYEHRIYSSSKDMETNEDIENVILVVGNIDGAKTHVSVKYNDDEIAIFDIKEWTEAKKDVEYKIIISEEESISGTFKLTTEKNDERNKNMFELSLESGTEYIKLNLEITQDWTSEVANINTGSATTLEEEQLAQKHQEFVNAVMETPIGILFKTVSGDTNPEINDYYEINPPVVEQPEDNADNADGNIVSE